MWKRFQEKTENHKKLWKTAWAFFIPSERHKNFLYILQNPTVYIIASFPSNLTYSVKYCFCYTPRTFYCLEIGEKSKVLYNIYSKKPKVHSPCRCHHDKQQADTAKPIVDLNSGILNHRDWVLSQGLLHRSPLQKSTAMAVWATSAYDNFKLLQPFYIFGCILKDTTWCLVHCICKFTVFRQLLWPGSSLNTALIWWNWMELKTSKNCKIQTNWNLPSLGNLFLF